MTLNRTNQILALALIVQVMVAVVVFFPGSEPQERPGEPLLEDFSTDSVAEITIRDSNDNEIVIARRESGAWVLPSADDYPVQASRVTSLLNNVAALETGRLIARNPSSHNRLGVGDEDFERLVELRQGDDQVDRVYIGTSAGGGAAHTRVNDRAEVYLNTNLAAFDVPTRVTSWVNVLYFDVNRDNIVNLRVENANGVFEFVKEGEEWTFLGLEEGEVFNPESISDVVRQAANVRMAAPIGTEEEERFGMGNPSATITLTTREEVQPEPEATAEAAAEATAETTPEATPEVTPEATTEAEPEIIENTYTLLVGAQLEDGDYVVKSSESEYYVAVSTANVDDFLNLTHEDLLQAPPEVTPESTAEATEEATPEVESTVEPEITAEPASSD